ncbi:MAG: hypothetical protein R3B45_14765 [Bdellovibrionota bacterium]
MKRYFKPILLIASVLAIELAVFLKNKGIKKIDVPTAPPPSPEKKIDSNDQIKVGSDGFEKEFYLTRTEDSLMRVRCDRNGGQCETYFVRPLSQLYASLSDYIGLSDLQEQVSKQRNDLNMQAEAIRVFKDDAEIMTRSENERIMAIYSEIGDVNKIIIDLNEKISIVEMELSWDPTSQVLLDKKKQYLSEKESNLYYRDQLSNEKLEILRTQNAREDKILTMDNDYQRELDRVDTFQESFVDKENEFEAEKQKFIQLTSDSLVREEELGDLLWLSSVLNIVFSTN